MELAWSVDIGKSRWRILWWLWNEQGRNLVSCAVVVNEAFDGTEFSSDRVGGTLGSVEELCNSICTELSKFDIPAKLAE
jgi:hypothetical protein